MPLPSTPNFKSAQRIVAQARAKNHTYTKIARRLFSYEKPTTLVDANGYDRAFDLYASIAEQFRVPFQSIRAVGSGQLGCSCHNARDFIPKTSDLDLAIVDSNLYSQYCMHAALATKDYTDLTKFPNIQKHQAFIETLAKGFFRPDLMPTCPAKNAWFQFFGQTSTRFVDLYSTVNCGIYLSEDVFERKQLYEVEKLAL